MKDQFRNPSLARDQVIGFTGTICAGKDYCAEQIGARVESMAAPLYGMTELFFGFGMEDRNRDLPGLRECWQRWGQWGRGTVSAQYPLTAERALFCERARELGGALLHRQGTDYGVDWTTYGRDPDIWLDGLLVRIYNAKKDELVAVTNLRFENEVQAFAEQGWSIIHVTASLSTLVTRRIRQNVQSAALEDVSEAYARRIDELLQDVTCRSTPTPLPIEWLNDNGFPHNAIVWNDLAPAPDSTYLTVGQLKEIL